MLKDALKIRTANVKNVRILDNLKELINIFASKIEEDLIDFLTPIASEIFFVKSLDASLYYKEMVREKIIGLNLIDVKTFPDDTTNRVEQGTWYISEVSFVKKHQQRITWSSRIEIELIAYRDLTRLEELLKSQADADAFKIQWSNTKESQNKIIWPQNVRRTLATSTTGSESEKIHLKGKSIFEVIWSTTYSKKKTLINPKIESIDFIETLWD